MKHSARLIFYEIQIFYSIMIFHLCTRQPQSVKHNGEVSLSQQNHNVGEIRLQLSSNFLNISLPYEESLTDGC